MQLVYIMLREFQSTRLREARPKLDAKLRAYCMFQSTRLREARLAVTVSRNAETVVSIHAPA